MPDSDRELVIPLGIDRRKAKQQLAEHEGETRQSIDRTTAYETASFEKRLEAARRVDAQRKADAAKTAEGVKSIEDQYILKDYQARVTAEQKKQQLSRQTTEKYLEQQVKIARANESLASGFAGTAAAGIAIGAVTGVMSAITSVTEQGRAKAAELAKEFLATRDALRALASATGQPASGKLAVDTALFGAKTGLGAEKSRQFLEPFESAAGDIKGQKLSAPEYDKFREYSATLAQAKNLDPSVAGELAGSVASHEDFAAKGQGGIEAAARFKQGMGILEMGKGHVAKLAPQMQKLMGLVSENKMESHFRNFSEAASLVSTQAQGNPEEAAVHTLHGARGLFDFQNKDKAEFFKRAGIAPDASATEAFQAANRVIGEEVQKGLTVDQAVDKLGLGKDIREKDAYVQAYLARDTAFAANVARANAPLPVAETEKEMADYKATQPGMMAQQKGAGEAQAAVKGSEGSGWEVLKQGARNKLGEGRLNGSWEKAGYTALSGFGYFGMGSAEDMMVEGEALRMKSPTAAANPFLSTMGMATNAGGMRDQAIATANNEPLPADTVQAVKNFTAALNKQTAAALRAPAALPSSPPQMGR